MLCQKAVETLKKQSREGWRGGHGRGARTEARCCRVHPMGPPGPHSQTSLCLTPWPHPKPSCPRTKTSGRCGGRSCLLPNPYLGAKGTRAENRGKRQPSPPHRLPAGRLGAVLAPCVFPQLASFLACWLVFCSRFGAKELCWAGDDVIPLPQARCGEHGRSPGPAEPRRGGGTVPRGNGAGGTSPRAHFGVPGRDWVTLLLGLPTRGEDPKLQAPAPIAAPLEAQDPVPVSERNPPSKPFLSA